MSYDKLVNLLKRCERALADANFGHHCPVDYRGLQIEISAALANARGES